MGNQLLPFLTIRGEVLCDLAGIGFPAVWLSDVAS